MENYKNYYPHRRHRYLPRKPYSRGRTPQRRENSLSRNTPFYYPRSRNSNWNQSDDSEYSFEPIRANFYNPESNYRSPSEYRHNNHRPPPGSYTRNVIPPPAHFCEDDYDDRFDDIETEPPTTEQEQKALRLTASVYTQGGVKSKLIFVETEADKELQTLQSAVDYCQLQLVIDFIDGEYVLKINQEEFGRGKFENKQTAKATLAQTALEELKKSCFYIIKKKVYEEVDPQASTSEAEPQPKSTLEGSKAHQMMLKMGWSGKGLGVNEQGQEQTVAEKIDQNITRQGLGTKDVMKEINNILEDFARSNKLTILRFAPDFTTDERAYIHKIAAKFGLKSKSEGRGDQRRITISKKVNRQELVYQLLVEGCENSVYKLITPSNFEF